MKKLVKNKNKILKLTVINFLFTMAVLFQESSSPVKVMKSQAFQIF